MPSTAEKRALFRAQHVPGRPLLMPNPYDPGTARILEGLGFAALATTSAGYAFTRGLRDACGLVTRDMAIAHAADIVAATHLPVNGDLENGFGDAPEAAAETVRAAIDAGLAGCSIEDRCSESGRIYPLDLAVERIRAAAAIRDIRATDFVLTARAEDAIHDHQTLDVALARLSAFIAAGADCVYAPELSDAAHIRRAAGTLCRPLNVLAGRLHFPHSMSDLAGMGVARVSIGSGLARVAFGAFYAAAAAMRDTGRFTVMDQAAGWESFDVFMEESPATASLARNASRRPADPE